VSSEGKYGRNKGGYPMYLFLSDGQKKDVAAILNAGAAFSL
jgi:hypothetical protein